MNLFYTTTTGYNNGQANPDRSLGGYKSSTPLVNDDFSNVFDSLSILTIKNGRDEYRAIVIRNDFIEKISQLTIKIKTPEDGLCTYKLAIGQLNGVNKYNQRYMENVLTGNNKPFHARFVDMDNESIFEIGDLEPGTEIGLWICRHVDKEAAQKQYESVCEPDPNDPTGRRYRPVTHLDQESVEVIFDWI